MIKTKHPSKNYISRLIEEQRAKSNFSRGVSSLTVIVGIWYFLSKSFSCGEQVSLSYFVRWLLEMFEVASVGISQEKYGSQLSRRVIHLEP